MNTQIASEKTPPAWLVAGGRLLVSLFVPLVLFLVLWRVFLFLRDSQSPTWLIASVAILWGVGGALALFFTSNWVIERLPGAWRHRLIPFLFVGPALAILAWYLLVPTFRTFYASLFDANGQIFVGLQNYIYAFTSRGMVEAFRNNLFWLLIVTSGTVGFALVIAVLADRTHPKFEVVAKSLIFMPMVISMVGASVIWRLIYDFRPGDAEQIGLLNAVVTALGQPSQAWMLIKPWNNLFLMVIVIWLQTGYAMVIISAAIKAIPGELLEAARIDGANEFRVFTKIIIPSLRGTLVTVATTIILFTLKIFDVVQAMTGGNYGTQVIANEQYMQMFRAFHAGRSAAIAVVLLLLVIPVMIYNLRQFNQRPEAFL
ncbi:MAG: ABC transporter permease subunit [Anaerolineae bacterium]